MNKNCFSTIVVVACLTLPAVVHAQVTTTANFSLTSFSATPEAGTLTWNTPFDLNAESISLDNVSSPDIEEDLGETISASTSSASALASGTASVSSSPFASQVTGTLSLPGGSASYLAAGEELTGVDVSFTLSQATTVDFSASLSSILTGSAGPNGIIVDDESVLNTYIGANHLHLIPSLSFDDYQYANPNQSFSDIQSPVLTDSVNLHAGTYNLELDFGSVQEASTPDGGETGLLLLGATTLLTAARRFCRSR